MGSIPHPRDAESSPPPDRRLAELAARQWGVVSIDQLAALGIGRGAVTKRVRAGRLHRLHAGVYAVGHKRLGREGRYLAAVLACGPGAAMSHRSAAAWWGLLASSATSVDVSAARGRHGGRGIRLHRPRSLDAQDTTHHEGIPITSVARTLLDLAATARPRELERALAQTQHQRLYDHTAIEDVIERTNGHRGQAKLARATQQEPALTRSELEDRFLDLIDQANLPRPRVNAPLDAPDHGRIVPDFHWPDHRLIVETDGEETHGTRAAFRNDRRRDAALAAAGHRVVRFTWDDLVNEPGVVKSRLGALLRE